MDLKSLLFDFSGRINRAKYWITVPIMLGIVLVCLIGAAIIGVGEGAFVYLNPFLVVGFVLLAWINIAVGIKRLHDRGKSGIWLVLFYGMPLLLDRLGTVLDENSTATYVVGMVGLALGIWGFVEIACLKGTEGRNEYGPDPLGATQLG